MFHRLSSSPPSSLYIEGCDIFPCRSAPYHPSTNLKANLSSFQKKLARFPLFSERGGRGPVVVKRSERRAASPIPPGLSPFPPSGKKWRRKENLGRGGRKPRWENPPPFP